MSSRSVCNSTQSATTSRSKSSIACIVRMALENWVTALWTCSGEALVIEVGKKGVLGTAARSDCIRGVTTGDYSSYHCRRSSSCRVLDVSSARTQGGEVDGARTTEMNKAERATEAVGKPVQVFMSAIQLKASSIDDS